MALDGILLSRIIPEIRKELPLRIQKIWDISPNEILFQVHGASGKQQLLISCHSVYNRMLLTKRSYPTPAEPGNFVMLLRKYLEGAVFETVDQPEYDRWCVYSITRRNHLGDLEKLFLYVELMGKYANMILVNAEGRIIDALKRIPPFENSRRIIIPNAVFPVTPSQNKQDPFHSSAIDPAKTLTAQFAGFSPFLSAEVEYRMAHGQSFASVMEEIRDSKMLYIANKNNEPVFHCIELKSIGPCVSYPVFEAFDILYYRREEKERIKQVSGDLYHFARRQLNHYRQKLPRLLKEYDEAKDCGRWNKYGELLYTHQVSDTKGMQSITLEDYETGQLVTVPLDPKLDGKGNARKCYQKYSKLRKGQTYLQEQIRICEEELSYFEGILEQLDQADFTTASEIRDELIRLSYMKDSRSVRRKKKKETAPSVTSVRTPSGVVISYGRNNLQNEQLTWKTAKKDEVWLHAKDYHGSHVVIHDPSPDEDTLRLAAMIAAYYSAGRQSSSVPVVYCPVRNLKKIPGAKPGMVQLGSYKMIYIDPEEETLEKAGIEVR
ncbi:MAG: NFACT family protein [Solobacterium sp.]|nr:NFACT family protein [Solobacterium sp.]